MSTNHELILSILQYIEEHMKKDCTLDIIAHQFGYSKYHLHRMFTSITGYPLHEYLTRRRLTLAAYALYASSEPILTIALDAGYETQRSFHKAFVKRYHCSPKNYRLQQQFYPLQLPLQETEVTMNCRSPFLSITQSYHQKRSYVGYLAHTKRGVWVIGSVWRKLHKQKHLIANRSNLDELIAIHEYPFAFEEDQPSFLYHALAQVDNIETLSKGMHTFEVDASWYVDFTYRGKNEDSVQSIITFIYHDWFPQSSCILNEQARYDMVAYGESMDEHGESIITISIPILAPEIT